MVNLCPQTTNIVPLQLGQWTESQYLTNKFVEVATFGGFFLALLDAAGYVVMSPALAPTPNGQYQTIDETLFNIQKIRLNQNEQER